MIDILIQKAKEMQQRAHAPYSNFHVGAVVQTDDEQIFGGCNIESASYGLTVCAERVAIFHAIAQGHSNFTHLVLTSDSGAYPCGACRQIIYEFCSKATIIIVTQSSVEYTTSKKLLPHAFGQQDIVNK